MCSLGKKCAYLIGGGQRLSAQWLDEVKLWSRKGLRRSHGTANKRMNSGVTSGAEQEITRLFTS